ncbi:MAG: 3-hydroxyisobutyrate dehydrogenase [Gammaproteobacteria bacterium]
MIKKVAFAGLGNMGLPMAKNLLAAGFAVVGADVQKAQTDAFADAGGSVAKSAAAASANADVVITMLPSDAEVRAVYLGDGGILECAKEGALLADCSTIDVAAAVEVAAAAKARRDMPMLDAPVSGGVAGARAATLTFMVGGEEDAAKRADVLFSAMGKNAVYAGAAGSGQAAKICNNMLLGVSMIGVAEAFNLAQKLGLDARAFYDVAANSSGQCWSLTSYCPVPGLVLSSPSNRDYEPGFAASLMLKDLRLSQKAAAENKVQTPLGKHAEEIYAAMNTEGGGGKDFSAVIKMLRGAKV